MNTQGYAPLPRRSRSPSAYLTWIGPTPWKYTDEWLMEFSMPDCSRSKELTPGKVYWLCKALIALSASSEVAYFTKQQPAEVRGWNIYWFTWALYSSISYTLRIQNQEAKTIFKIQNNNITRPQSWQIHLTLSIYPKKKKRNQSSKPRTNADIWHPTSNYPPRKV